MSRRPKVRRGNAAGGGGDGFAKVLGFLICVGLPAFWTAIAPVSVTRLNREGDFVRAHTQDHVFFIIPYRTRTVADVTAIDDRFREGEWDRRSSDPSKHTKSESESFLVLHGHEDAVEVSVSPASIDRVVREANAFLADGSRPALRLITVANWKFSVIFAIPLTLLTALYLFGCALALWRWTHRKEAEGGLPGRGADAH